LARKTTTRIAAASADDDPFHICLAYQLGGLPCLFESAAQAMWLTAQQGDPLPPAMPAWSAQLNDLVDRLAAAGAAQLLRHRDAVRGALEGFLDDVEGQWDGPTHRRLVEWFEVASETEPGEWPTPRLSYTCPVRLSDAYNEGGTKEREERK
jgi:hypothetical protein